MARKLRPLVAGNWKMYGLRRDLSEVRKLINWLGKNNPSCDVMICPPATLIAELKEVARGSKLRAGAQHCHNAENGAHTGDISAAMLKNAGASAVIAGHSERRADHGEENADVRAQAETIHNNGLTAIICVGETLVERNDGKTLRVIGAQLKGSLPKAATGRNTIIAYEPVWAIGSGKTPTVEDVAKVHRHIRKRLQDILGKDEAAKVRLLYGGSVKPENAAELLAVENVDGALVGGASLKTKDFAGIIATYI